MILLKEFELFSNTLKYFNNQYFFYPYKIQYFLRNTRYLAQNNAAKCL